MNLRLTALAAALAIGGGGALAQAASPPAGQPTAQPASQRFSGAVKSVTASDLVLTTDKGDVDLLFTAQTRVLARSAASASDIRTGTYLGTANVTTPDGGRANEVHLMDDGPNVHMEMNGDPDLMMTNGHVKSVQTTANGEEMDVDYGSGVQHVVVPAGTPITRLTPLDVTSLKIGEMVTASARPDADGKLTATYITPAAAPK